MATYIVQFPYQLHYNNATQYITRFCNSIPTFLKLYIWQLAQCLLIIRIGDIFSQQTLDIYVVYCSMYVAPPFYRIKLNNSVLAFSLFSLVKLWIIIIQRRGRIDKCLLLLLLWAPYYYWCICVLRVRSNEVHEEQLEKVQTIIIYILCFCH